MHRIVTIILLSLVCLGAIAKDYDFSAKSNGTEIYYKINDDNKTVSIVPKKKYKESYSGDIIIPASVTYKDNDYKVTCIGSYAFNECSLLTSITIPNSVTSIEAGAFHCCYSLTSITIPNSVINIGNRAFYGCSKLASITIPNSVTSIGDFGFSYCNSLTSITIPNSVTSIGVRTFWDCRSLTSIIIPNSVKSIREYAFCCCTLLKTITIPASVTSIGKRAFSSCISLSSITIPSTVTSIDETAFSYCNSLKTIICEDKDIAQRFSGIFPKGVEFVTKPPFDPTKPPCLDIVEGSVKFIDSNGTNSIDANEACVIEFNVINTGTGPAHNCMVRVKSSQGSINAKGAEISEIKPGETVHVSISINADHNTADGKVDFKFFVEEPNGFDTDEQTLVVQTNKFAEPNVMVADYSVTSADGSSMLARKRPFDLQALVQNTARGLGENVVAEIMLPENVILMDGGKSETLGTLAPGETRELNYSLVVNNRYTADEIPITISLREKYGKYAESRTINLKINQPLETAKIEVKGRERNNADITVAQIDGKVQQADVDLNIPQGAGRAENTFAIIISCENYKREVPVRFATNDANIMSQYMVKTLGLPTENVHLVTDATKNEIAYQLDWIKQVDKAYGGNASFIVYYAGHGMPDEKTGAAYIVPNDGFSGNLSSCIPVRDVYAQLGALQSNNVVLMLDACFSGTQRGDGMLAEVRGIALKPKADAVGGNVCVLSAAQADETAWPYTEMGHGMFTYYLLKKLQENGAALTLGELADYLNTEIPRRSIVLNQKAQTPAVSVSPTLTNSWRSMRLVK